LRALRPPRPARAANFSAKIFHEARIQGLAGGHLQFDSNDNSPETRITAMTRIAAIAAAFTLFAPVAAAVLMQAAQIVA